MNTRVLAVIRPRYYDHHMPTTISNDDRERGLRNIEQNRELIDAINARTAADRDAMIERLDPEFLSVDWKYASPNGAVGTVTIDGEVFDVSVRRRR